MISEIKKKQKKAEETTFFQITKNSLVLLSSLGCSSQSCIGQAVVVKSFIYFFVLAIILKRFHNSIKNVKSCSEMWHMQNMWNYRIDNVNDKLFKQQQKFKNANITRMDDQETFVFNERSGALTSIIGFLLHETTISLYKL